MVIFPQTTKADDDVDLRTLLPDNYIVEENSSMPLPDVWLEPRVVWEVKGAALSLSPVHTAGADIIHEKQRYWYAISSIYSRAN